MATFSDAPDSLTVLPEGKILNSGFCVCCCSRIRNKHFPRLKIHFLPA